MASASARAPDEELAAGERLELSTPGDFGGRLDTGLSADRLHRHQRQEVLLQRLRRAHGLGTAGRWACVIASFLTLPVGALLITATSLDTPAWSLVVWSAMAGFAGIAAALFGLGPVLALTASLWGRRLLKQAQHEFIELAPPSPPAATATSAPESDHAERERRTAEYQLELNRVEAAGHAVQRLCVAAGCAVWLILLQALVFPGYSELLRPVRFVLLSTCVLALFGSVVPAGWALLHRGRRQRLLQEAAREGLPVRDPARSPWEPPSDQP